MKTKIPTYLTEMDPSLWGELGKLNNSTTQRIILSPLG